MKRFDWSRDWFDLCAICYLALLWWLWLEASRMPEHVMKNQQVSEQKMTQHIRVWSIHDDPEQCEHPEDRTWIAIAAEDKNQALALAAAFYDGDTPRDEWNWTTAFAATEIHTANWPEDRQPRFPHRISSLEVLRLIRVERGRRVRVRFLRTSSNGLAMAQAARLLRPLPGVLRLRRGRTERTGRRRRDPFLAVS